MSTMAGPLAGVSVLELGTMYAAPTCGRMLRDFGARVIKVEDPGTGDYARPSSSRPATLQALEPNQARNPSRQPRPPSRKNETSRRLARNELVASVFG